MTDFVSKNGLFTKQDRIGAALSGGADSVALVSCLKREGYDVVALHVEHGIRGEESVNDMVFSEQLCKKLDVPLYIKRISVMDEKEKGESVEEAARRLRYAFFEEAAKKLGLKYIAVAHHIEDASETFIFNLLRGSGLKGLSSMRAKRQPNIVRPLLFATRRELESYLKEEGLSFVTDKTNDDENYTRNYLRKTVLPTFKRINPGYDNALLRTSQMIAEEDDALTCISKAEYEKIVSFKSQEEAIIDIEGLAKLHPAIAKRVIRLALEEVYALKDVELQHVLAIYNLALNAKTGKKFELKGKFFAEVSYNSLKISAKDYIIKKYGEILLNIDGITPLWEDKSIVCEKMDAQSALILASKASKESFFQTVNQDALKGAVVRTRKSGDFFCPFGGKRKKLKDWFIDKKIPREMRNQMLLVAKGSEVLWVIGESISQKLRIDENTKNTVRIKFIERTEEE